VGEINVVVDKLRVDGSRVRLAEVLLGDETGTVSFRARDEQIDLLQGLAKKFQQERAMQDCPAAAAAAIVLRNCTVELFQSKHMRLAVTKWGKLYPHSQDLLPSTPQPPSAMKRDLNFSLADFSGRGGVMMQQPQHTRVFSHSRPDKHQAMRGPHEEESRAPGMSTTHVLSQAMAYVQAVDYNHHAPVSPHYGAYHQGSFYPAPNAAPHGQQNRYAWPPAAGSQGQQGGAYVSPHMSPHQDRSWKQQQLYGGGSGGGAANMVPVPAHQLCAPPVPFQGPAPSLEASTMRMSLSSSGISEQDPNKGSRMNKNKGTKKVYGVGKEHKKSHWAGVKQHQHHQAIYYPHCGGTLHQPVGPYQGMMQQQYSGHPYSSPPQGYMMTPLQHSEYNHYSAAMSHKLMHPTLVDHHSYLRPDVAVYYVPVPQQQGGGDGTVGAAAADPALDDVSSHVSEMDSSIMPPSSPHYRSYSGGAGFAPPPFFAPVPTDVSPGGPVVDGLSYQGAAMMARQQQQHYGSYSEQSIDSGAWMTSSGRSFSEVPTAVSMAVLGGNLDASGAYGKSFLMCSCGVSITFLHLYQSGQLIHNS
jgi:hypothetical protein